MSSVISPPINNCSAAILFAKSNSLFIVHTLHCIMSTFAIILLIECLKILTDSSRKIFVFHVNLKIVFLGGSLFYVIYAAFDLASNLRDMIFYFTYFDDPCAYLTVAWNCSIFKFPPVMCIIGFTFFHTAVLIDRLCANFYANSYEKQSAKAGISAVVVMMISTILYSFYIFHNEDFGVIKSKCNPNSVYTTNKLQYMNYVMLSIDLLVTLTEFYLRHLINRQNRTKIVNYNLQTSYLIKENLLSIQLIFPLALVHSSIFLSCLLVLSIGKAVIEFPDAITFSLFAELATLIVNFYIITTLTTFLYLLKKVENARKVKLIKSSQSADIYFQQLHGQIQ